jgi:hypothetical protein
MTGTEATLVTQIWSPASSSCGYLRHRSPTGSRHPPTNALPLARDARRHSSPTQELRSCRSSRGRHGEERAHRHGCAQSVTHFFDLGEGVWTLHRRPWRMRMTAWGESSEAMTSPPPPPRCSRSRASSPSDAPPPFSAHIGYVFGFADWN